jgi:hypothetical protein
MVKNSSRTTREVDFRHVDKVGCMNALVIRRPHGLATFFLFNSMIYYMKERTMKYLTNATGWLTGAVIIAGLFFPVSASQRSITVAATVIDSASRQPIPEARVMFYTSSTIQFDSSNMAKMVGNSKLDTATCGSNGKLSFPMKIASNSLVLVCPAFKKDYVMGYKTVFLQPTATSVDIGSIKLQKWMNSRKDTLTITGTLIDSATLSPMPGCFIYINGLGGWDTAGNTSVSGADGKFSKKVIIASLVKTLAYTVVKEQDMSWLKSGMRQYATSKQISLGTMRLPTQMSGILTNNVIVRSQPGAKGLKIYTISGGLLYSGPVSSFGKIQRRFPYTSVVIVTENEKSRIVRKNVVCN